MAFLTHYGIKINTFLKKHCRLPTANTLHWANFTRNGTNTEKKGGFICCWVFVFKNRQFSFFPGDPAEEFTSSHLLLSLFDKTHIKLLGPASTNSVEQIFWCHLLIWTCFCQTSFYAHYDAYQSTSCWSQAPSCSLILCHLSNYGN